MTNFFRSSNIIKGLLTKYLGVALNKLHQDKILLLAGASFITRKLELPPEIDKKEIHSYLELSLEEFSPFPLEQLYWGFIHDINSSTVLLYATRKENHTTEGKEIQSAYHVFPSFLPACKIAPADSPRIVTCLVKQTLSFLFLEEGKSIPSKVVNEELSFPPAEEGIEIDIKTILEIAFKAQSNFLSSLDTDKYNTTKGITYLDSSKRTTAEAIEFRFKHIESLAHEAEPLNLITFQRGPSRWDSDIRIPEFKRREQKNRILNRRLWKSLQIVGIAFLALTGLEIIRLIGIGVLHSKENKAISQQGPAATIENKNDLLEKMDHFSDLDLRPFYMMGVLNEVRSKDLYFQSIIAKDVNLLIIKGIAASVDSVNLYTDALNEKNNLEDIELADISTRKGEVQFTLNIRFKSLLNKEL